LHKTNSACREDEDDPGGKLNADSTHREGGRIMPAKQLLSDEEARRVIQRDLDRRTRAVKASFKGRHAGLDEKSGAPTSPKEGETVRKMARPGRRYWPSPNSQRAPSRPQASKGSPK
jgi:hypothetical protein